MRTCTRHSDCWRKLTPIVSPNGSQSRAAAMKGSERSACQGTTVLTQTASQVTPDHAKHPNAAMLIWGSGVCVCVCVCVGGGGGGGGGGSG